MLPFQVPTWASLPHQKAIAKKGSWPCGAAGRMGIYRNCVRHGIAEACRFHSQLLNWRGLAQAMGRAACKQCQGGEGAKLLRSLAGTMDALPGLLARIHAALPRIIASEYAQLYLSSMRMLCCCVSFVGVYLRCCRSGH